MLINFAALFAVIWWAWMNYTLVASAFDNGNTLFILLTMTIVGRRCGLCGGVEESKHIASLPRPFRPD